MGVRSRDPARHHGVWSIHTRERGTHPHLRAGSVRLTLKPLHGPEQSAQPLHGVQQSPRGLQQPPPSLRGQQPLQPTPSSLHAATDPLSGQSHSDHTKTEGAASVKIERWLDIPGVRTVTECPVSLCGLLCLCVASCVSLLVSVSYLGLAALGVCVP